MLKLFAALFIALSSLTAQSADLNLKKDNLEIGKFNFETKRVLLNSGYYMPLVGLCTYSLNHDECMLSVGTLLKSGGRLIDTAYMYHNEKSVEQAVRESGVPREEMFVTTKIYQKKISG